MSRNFHWGNDLADSGPAAPPRIPAQPLRFTFPELCEKSLAENCWVVPDTALRAAFGEMRASGSAKSVSDLDSQLGAERVCTKHISRVALIGAL